MNDRIPGYSLAGKLGEGGMGDVYRARQISTRRDVAVKVLSPRIAAGREELGRFMREAILLSTLRHPNVCRLVDSGETEKGDFFFVTELLHGRTLAQLLLRQGALEPRRAVAIALQVARGLEAAHERRIVHCDVKPSNLMVTPDGTVKILDFGLARLTHVEEMDRGLSAGTVAYASPELLAGTSGDPRIDVWSLGAVLHELLTGRPAFLGTNRTEVANAVLGARRQPLSGLADEVRAAVVPVLDRALAPGVDDRYPSASAFAADLETLLDRLPEPADLPPDDAADAEAETADPAPRSVWRRLRRLWAAD